MRDVKRIKPFMNWLENEWTKNPDYRFGQLLINLGLVEDGIKTWRAEMTDYPLPFEVEREIISWAALDNDLQYKKINISELSTTHIKNILETQNQIKKTPMEGLLKKELKYRKKNKIK